MSENGPWTVIEDVDFINFLVEKTDNVISSLDSAQLCNEFKQRSGSTRTVESLVKRIDVICWEPHFTYFRKLMDFDAYKRLKMMFTSSAPISLFLLNEREEKEAFLELDDRNRREIQFSKVPLNLSICEINEKLTEFLTEISQNPSSPTNSVVFVKQFDAETILRQQYRIYKNQIHAPHEYEKAKTLKKLFASQAEIDDSVLREFREGAVADVDEKNRIIELKKNDDILVLKAEHHIVKKRKEDEKLINFIAKKCKETNSPLSISRLGREFVEKTGISVKEATIEYRIRSLISKIQKLTIFNTETKVRLLFSLSAPIDQEYLNELRKEAVVEIDGKNRILKYKANDGSSELNRLIRNYGNVERKEKENEELIKFIAEKSNKTNSPLCIKQLSEEFIEKVGSSVKERVIRTRIRSLLLKIPKLEDFDTETKVRMLISLSASVDQEYLNVLRVVAIVKVDEKNRIIEYKANDGNVNLQGDHSWSTKCRTAGWASFRKRSLILDDSEEEEEKEGSEEEEEVKEEKTSGYITNRVGISKKRYLNDDFLQDEVETCTKASLGQQQTYSENETLLNFIAEKSRQANSPLCISQLCRDFIENSGSSRKARAMRSRMFLLRMKIPKLDNFDTPTKVRMLFSLSVPIDKDYLEELRKNAIVEVDEYQRIIKYKANNGRLKLKGRHWSSTIKRNFQLQIASTKKFKLSESQCSEEDVIYDGPGEPIPAELPVKQEPNVYDELIWREFSRGPITNQLPIRQHPIKYQEQNCQEEKYKPDKMELVENPVPVESHVKLEPMEYQEQSRDWKEEEEYKPNPLKLFNTEQYPNDNTTEGMKLEDSQILEYDELDYFVEK